jgi:hypothetical protein
MSTHADDIDDDPVVRRVVSAASAPSAMPEGAVVSAFNLPHLARYQRDGGAQEPSTEPNDDEQHEEQPMPAGDNKPAAARNVQQRLCEVLAASDRPLEQPQIVKALSDLTSGQVSSGLWNLSATSRAKRDNSSRWSITSDGRKWLKAKQSGEEGAKPEAAAAAPKKKRGRPAKSAAPAKRAKKAKVTEKRPKRAARTPAPRAEPPTPPSNNRAIQLPRTFRCAVFSDGGFMLAKGDMHIELDAAEHRQMLAYIERMAEPDGE